MRTAKCNTNSACNNWRGVSTILSHVQNAFAVPFFTHTQVDTGRGSQMINHQQKINTKVGRRASHYVTITSTRVRSTYMLSGPLLSLIRRSIRVTKL